MHATVFFAALAKSGHFAEKAPKPAAGNRTSLGGEIRMHLRFSRGFAPVFVYD
ncbi:hypothetical protein NSU_0494 [Novosphingobium pentaromativorans US6-1]|uniref:Uncharacterized protein n=1 Tax=Novosphingobium pentaromativorans US6-1 TaxID=1088721 RepID=G6E823_9SPHN|nr:hypothetical protein NSU_0494 [Novosphingobium pentaromativorans US6-1]